MQGTLRLALGQQPVQARAVAAHQLLHRALGRGLPSALQLDVVREDLEARGPVRLSEVEAEQKEILKTVRRLAEEGQVMLGGKGGDDGFV